MAKKLLNQPSFREIDDKIVSAIKLLDTALVFILKEIVKNHKEFMADILINTIRSLDNYAGGIRLIAKSRKKDTSKLAILELISYIDKPPLFIKYMNTLGLSRRARHTLLITFINTLSKHYLKFLSLYKDPTFTYISIIPVIHAYTSVRKHVINITFRYLSKTVLSKYAGWVLKRNIVSSLDYVRYEEDVQNSIFYIETAFGLFNTKMHKSFFSYASWWLRYGIKKVSEFSQKEDSSIFREYEEGTTMEIRDTSATETGYSNDDQAYNLISELCRCSLPLSIEFRILKLLLNK